jgi:hypothetical protein
MRKHLAVFGIFFTFFIFLICQNVQAEDPVKEAKDAFSKFAKAAKAKKLDAAKKYIAKNALEELEKEGMLDMMIELWSELNPNAFKVESESSERVIFKMQQKETTKEGTMTTSATVNMIKEDGQWKISKPEEK